MFDIRNFFKTLSRDEVFDYIERFEDFCEILCDLKQEDWSRCFLVFVGDGMYSLIMAEFIAIPEDQGNFSQSLWELRKRIKFRRMERKEEQSIEVYISPHRTYRH